jgi:hypothetical protein
MKVKLYRFRVSEYVFNGHGNSLIHWPLTGSYIVRRSTLLQWWIWISSGFCRLDQYRHGQYRRNPYSGVVLTGRARIAGNFVILAKTASTVLTPTSPATWASQPCCNGSWLACWCGLGRTVRSMLPDQRQGLMGEPRPPLPQELLPRSTWNSVHRRCRALTTTLFESISEVATSGRILTPGVYAWRSCVSFSADIAFRGGINDVFIIRTTQNFAQGGGGQSES